MAMSINTNIASLNAQKNLGKTQGMLDKSLARLSSGLRINSAKDDAAGLAISNRMGAQVRGLNQAARNANDAISLAQTAEGALQESTNILQRMRELAVQSKNSTNTASDRSSLDQEFQQLSAELNRIGDTTSFNGQMILDGSMGASVFQVGSQVGETISLDLSSDMRASSIGTYTSKTYSLAADADATAADTWLSDDAGDITINNVSIDAATGGANGQGAGSAKSIASAINAKTDDHGVTASATATTKTIDNSTIESFGGWVDGVVDDTLLYTLTINDQQILTEAEGSTGVTATALASAINTYASTTGVVAQVDSAGDMTLTAADGRNIEIKETLNGSTAEVVVDDVTGYFGHDLHATGVTSIDNYDITKADLTVRASQDITIAFDAADDIEQLFGLADATASDTSTASAINASNVLTGANADLAIYRADQALSDIDTFRGDLGAIQNRFESTIANLQSVSENISAARARIMDADFAAETAELTKAQVLQQAGVAMLAQANQLPQAVLSLLQ
ncbi:MAG: flagellin [Deltaproteobacteria bacterium]|nr:flagellin [Deltaproteobacteria bacterium]